MTDPKDGLRDYNFPGSKSTLALDKLPTPVTNAYVNERAKAGLGVMLVDQQIMRSLEQRLAYAVGLVNRLRPYAVGPHYADEYGNAIPEDLDTSPALLAEVDAFLALLREKP